MGPARERFVEGVSGNWVTDSGWNKKNWKEDVSDVDLDSPGWVVACGLNRAD